MMEIDGSTLEGGGQVLRISTTLAVLLRKPIKVSKIRAGRPKPGLKAQHLCGVELLGRLSGGSLAGAALNSCEFSLYPGDFPTPATAFQAHISTAGSVTLVMQSAVPCLAFAREPCSLSLRGGTNVHFAPQLDYTTRVFGPLARRMGLHFDVQLHRRGFFPKGGGELMVNVRPAGKLRPLNLMEKGKLLKITVIVAQGTQADPRKVEELVSSARKTLEGGRVGVPIKVERAGPTGPGDGSAVLLVAEHEHSVLAADFISKRGGGESVGAQTAASQLLSALQSGACVDEHAQDQLILLMALAEGRSAVRGPAPSLHTKTAIHFAELLTEARFTVQEEADGTTVISCEGIGYKTPGE